jgi:phage terminase large subunit
MQRLRDRRDKFRRARVARRGSAPRTVAPEFSGDLSRFRDDPVAFAREVFGIEPWEGQEKILNGVAGHTFVTCRSGHKCGKSTSVALAAWWFACTREGARVIITAPTGRQVKQVVWREIRRLWRLALKRGNPYGLPEPGLAPENGVALPHDSQILGFTAENQEAMAGISAPEMLFVVDEASGVDEAIFEALFGNMAGGAKIVLISNPTQTSGTFFDSHHGKQSPDDKDDWHRIHISSEDTPNARSGEKLIPGLAEQGWVKMLQRKWGREDPRYQVRVLGNFPTANPNGVIGIGLLELSHDRWDDAQDCVPQGALVLGVDVARFGDDSSVVQPVRGLYGYPPTEVYGYNSIEVAGLTLKTALDLRVGDETITINVDAGGGYGGGVIDQLRASIEERGLINITVNEIHPSAMAWDPQYDLKRDELWFGIRTWLEQGGQLPRHEMLDGELLAPIYTFTIRGSKIKVEPKDEIKKRLGRSPDFADALALALVRQPQTDWDILDEMENLFGRPFPGFVPSTVSN